MMEMYDNLQSQSPTTTTSSSGISNATTTNIDSAAANNNNNNNSSLVSWESLADNFLRQFNGPGTTGNESTVPGSGATEDGPRRTEAGIQLPFAAYQSLAAAVSTPATDIGNQFPEDIGGGGGSGGSDAFVSWAPTTPSQVFFFVKVVIMCFIIVSAVFGNLLVIVSVMRHRKLR